VPLVVDSEEAMKIVLEVVEGPHRGQEFTFDGHDNFIVGRARCAHFRLPKKDPYFSRVHFMVEVNPPRCRLVDMGSTNGTRVNDRRVQTADLSDGDVIRGGDTVLRVSVVDAPPVSPPPLPSRPSALAPLPEQQKHAAPETTKTYEPKLPEVSEDSFAPEPAPARSSIDADEHLPDIPGYHIDRRLGQGGMGVVYLARRDRDGSTVALKTIRPAVGGTGREVQRFLREAAILGKLQHPGIVAFHEMGQAGELLYFAMEYVPGTDAARLLAQHAPLPIGRAVNLICQALEALHFAHEQGFVHRDVKPANLLITEHEGREICKLADFGLARVYHSTSLSGLTMMGDTGGTLPYMPPEQITNYREAKPAADQYSTAATLYRLLTGHYPIDFGDAPKEQQLGRILMDKPVPVQNRRADVPVPLAMAIERGLSNDPESRYPSAGVFREVLLPFREPR